jgi:heme exporter protein A
VNAPAIAARTVTKRFGPVVALAGVDLEVPSGCLVALLGPNGAGKTTLLRLLAGLGRPSSGSLRVGAAPGDRRRTRAQVGFVGHATFLYSALTARENLVFAARVYGVRSPARRAAELLDQHGLAASADLPAGSFSRGMAQRLAIARGLVHDPEVLLLDEPFTGLDRPAADRIGARLRALRDAGRTVVLATHDLPRAARLADRAVVLARGRVVHAVDGGPLRVEDLEPAYLAAADG